MQAERERRPCPGGASKSDEPADDNQTNTAEHFGQPCACCADRLTERQALALALLGVLGVFEAPESVKAVELMRLAATIIAEAGALPARRENAVALFRKMLEAAAAEAFPITDAMVEAHRPEIDRALGRARRSRAA